MARATERLKQAMEVCELGALTLPNQVDVLMDAARAILQEVSTLTPPNEPERAGLYGKYTVYKNKDGSLVTDCFILRPAKDPAAVAALRAYAAATDNAELAADIINWVGAEPNESLTCKGCMYAPDCPSEIHCHGCARMHTDHYRRPPEGET